MDTILEMLAGGESLSGEEMGARLGITRAAVWKRIRGLRAQGFDIRGVGRSGYRLATDTDALHPVYWRRRLRTAWAGREAVYLDEVDSTNAEAKRRAVNASGSQEGAPHGLLVLADRQTAGRGRRGRGWESPPGMGLWMSLLVRPSAQAERIPSLALAVALAVADACEEAAAVEAAVKWPNDVLYNGKKLCGILLEMAADMDGAQWVVIGVGINLRHHEAHFSPGLQRSVAALDEARPGKGWRRPDVLLSLLEALEARYAAWAAGGVAALREDYARRSATLGRRVSVIAPDGEFSGLATDIDETGALLVRRDDGVISRVLAADVSVRGEDGYA